MAWVVDSCVLLDIALKDPDHGIRSAMCLENHRVDGLTVCPVSLIEIAPFFEASLVNVRAFLSVMGADAHARWTDPDTEAAARGWGTYVALKRSTRSMRRPIADILIGAFASRHHGLVTRNPNHFRPFFPELQIRTPGVQE